MRNEGRATSQVRLVPQTSFLIPRISFPAERRGALAQDRAIVRLSDLHQHLIGARWALHRPDDLALPVWAGSWRVDGDVLVPIETGGDVDARVHDRLAVARDRHFDRLLARRQRRLARGDLH